MEVVSSLLHLRFPDLHFAPLLIFSPLEQLFPSRSSISYSSMPSFDLPSSLLTQIPATTTEPPISSLCLPSSIRRHLSTLTLLYLLPPREFAGKEGRKLWSFVRELPPSFLFFLLKDRLPFCFLFADSAAQTLRYEISPRCICLLKLFPAQRCRSSSSSKRGDASTRLAFSLSLSNRKQPYKLQGHQDRNTTTPKRNPSRTQSSHLNTHSPPAARSTSPSLLNSSINSPSCSSVRS